jgi:hypothetical protein
MKKILSILVLCLLFGGSCYAKEVNLSCELTKYFFKEAVLSDEKQIPLSKVDPIDLKTATLSFDMEKKEFLNSNLMIQVTENAIKQRLKNNSNGPTGFGWKQTLVYQCKVVDKLF